MDQNVQGPADEPVERVMEPGPSTVRPKEPAEGLLERMRKKKVPAVIVTTKNGRLLGAGNPASFGATYFEI
jgi:CBS domain-containing protein